MGDGGVACLPLQQQKKHVMERLSNAAEKTLKIGNGFSSELLKGAGKKKKKKKKKVKVKVKRKKVIPAVKTAGVVKSELALDRVSGGWGSNDVASGKICGQKEEVEEGELGTLKWPGSEVENGEFVPEKPWPLLKSEIQNREIVNERWKEGQVEKGEFVSEKWRKEDVENGEIVAENARKGGAEKGEYGWWRDGTKDGVEKGEFIPDRWHRRDTGRDGHGYARIRRYQSGRDKGWKSERERERTPPSGRYTGDESFRKRELNASWSQHAKNAPRWENGQERNVGLVQKLWMRRKMSTVMAGLIPEVTLLVVG